MRRGYKEEVRAEAITKRYEGKTWKEVQAAIVEKFGLKPSIRQMQQWFDAYRGEARAVGGSEYVAKVIKEAADRASPLAQVKMMAEVIPIWSQLKQQYKVSDWDAGWIALLSFFETQVGREDFDRFIEKYRKIRDSIVVGRARV